jgi:hypothetical protein
MTYPTGIANRSAKVGKVARAGLGANTCEPTGQLGSSARAGKPIWVAASKRIWLAQGPTLKLLARKYCKNAYFSDRGRLFQADRGRRNDVAVAALGKRAGSGVTVA